MHIAQIANILDVIKTSVKLVHVLNDNFYLKGQSHEKVGEMSVWGISLGPN
jgi:hypothetical protein